MRSIHCCPVHALLCNRRTLPSTPFNAPSIKPWPQDHYERPSSNTLSIQQYRYTSFRVHREASQDGLTFHLCRLFFFPILSNYCRYCQYQSFHKRGEYFLYCSSGTFRLLFAFCIISVVYRRLVFQAPRLFAMYRTLK